MEIRRRQFCLTVTAGVVTMAVPSGSATARLRKGPSADAFFFGCIMVILGGVLYGGGVTVGGGVIIAIGILFIVVGATRLLMGFASKEGAAGVGNISRAARGEDKATHVAGPFVSNEMLGVPLAYVPQSAGADLGVSVACNGMVDAYNRFRTDYVAGESLDDALAGLRQSVEQAQAEVRQHEIGSTILVGATLSAEQQRIQTEGLPAPQENYLQACGFSDQAMEAFRQGELAADVTRVQGQTVADVFDQSVAALPDVMANPEAPGQSQPATPLRTEVGR